MSNTFSFTRKTQSIVEYVIGMSYIRLGLIYATMILGCSALYTVLFHLAPEHAPTLRHGTIVSEFLDALYFSVITATSVGYGDILPQGISKLLAALEVILGLSIFAILVSKPISERQERTLLRTHKLTLDSMLTNIREGFFLMRKDFDNLMQDAADGKLDDALLRNFAVALGQGQILMEDIPTFYDIDRHISGLDARREMLLAEAVQRTFDRLIHTLEVLDKHKLEWRGQRSVVRSLDELIDITQAVLPKWKIGTDQEAEARLDSIHALVSRLAKMVLH
ncbi:MAG: potassium channel family protein [Candidatus Peribacteraceae bacterium]